MTDDYHAELLALGGILERIATALEGRGQTFVNARPAATVTAAAWQCPIHHAVKVVPAGVSSRTGRPYDAFMACPVRDCDVKGPKAAAGVPQAPQPVAVVPSATPAVPVAPVTSEPGTLP